MITNLESGRKRDLTATELAQVASALHVSPLELLVDADALWDPVAIPGLHEPYSEMSNGEYLYRASPLRRHVVGGRETDLLNFFESLMGADQLAMLIEDWDPGEALSADERVRRARLVSLQLQMQLSAAEAWCEVHGGSLDDVAPGRTVPRMPRRLWAAFALGASALERASKTFPELVDYSRTGPLGRRGPLLRAFVDAVMTDEGLEGGSRDGAAADAD